MLVRNLRKMPVEVIWCYLITPILGDAQETLLRSLCILAFYVVIYENVTPVCVQVVVLVR